MHFDLESCGAQKPKIQKETTRRNRLFARDEARQVKLDEEALEKVLWVWVAAKVWHSTALRAMGGSAYHP